MNMITAQKECTRCHRTKPLGLFYKEREGKSPDGHRQWCKACFSEYNKEYYNSIKDEQHETQVADAKKTLQLDFGEALQEYLDNNDFVDSVRPDMVEKPPHYNQGGIECIDYIEQQLGEGLIEYCEGNVIKYMHRYRYKNGSEDLKKAQWYLTKLIEEVEGCYDES